MLLSFFVLPVLVFFFHLSLCLYLSASCFPAFLFQPIPSTLYLSSSSICRFVLLSLSLLAFVCLCFHPSFWILCWFWTLYFSLRSLSFRALYLSSICFHFVFKITTPCSYTFCHTFFIHFFTQNLHLSTSSAFVAVRSASSL